MNIDIERILNQCAYDDPRPLLQKTLLKSNCKTKWSRENSLFMIIDLNKKFGRKIYEYYRKDGKFYVDLICDDFPSCTTEVMSSEDPDDNLIPIFEGAHIIRCYYVDSWEFATENSIDARQSVYKNDKNMMKKNKKNFHELFHEFFVNTYGIEFSELELDKKSTYIFYIMGSQISKQTFIKENIVIEVGKITDGTYNISDCIKTLPYSCNRYINLDSCKILQIECPSDLFVNPSYEICARLAVKNDKTDLFDECFPNIDNNTVFNKCIKKLERSANYYERLYKKMFIRKKNISRTRFDFLILSIIHGDYIKTGSAVTYKSIFNLFQTLDDNIFCSLSGYTECDFWY